MSKREKSVCEPECCHQNKKEKKGKIKSRKKEILKEKAEKKKMKGRKNI